jgi:hypothetical protein
MHFTESANQEGWMEGRDKKHMDRLKNCTRMDLIEAARDDLDGFDWLGIGSRGRLF